MSNSAHFVANKRAAYEVPVRIRIFFDVAVITLSLVTLSLVTLSLVTLSLVVVASAQSPAPPRTVTFDRRTSRCVEDSILQDYSPGQGRRAMTSSKFRLAVAACSMTLMLTPAIVRSQSSAMEQRVAALKQSVARDQQNIRQYEWIETTVITLKDEEKSRQQKQCYYGAEGSLQKVKVSATPPPKKKRGLRGRIAENKKEELTDYMKQAVALVKSYVPPDPVRIQAVKDAGKVSLDLPGGGKGARVNLRDYAKPGDVLSVEVDPASNRVMGLTVATYLDDAKDTVTLDVRFSALQDGTGYPATEVLVANAKNLSVNVTNSGYRKSAH